MQWQAQLQPVNTGQPMCGGRGGWQWLSQHHAVHWGGSCWPSLTCRSTSTLIRGAGPALKRARAVQVGECPVRQHHGQQNGRPGCEGHQQYPPGRDSHLWTGSFQGGASRAAQLSSAHRAAFGRAHTRLFMVNSLCWLLTNQEHGRGSSGAAAQADNASHEAWQTSFLLGQLALIFSCCELGICVRKIPALVQPLAVRDRPSRIPALPGAQRAVLTTAESERHFRQALRPGCFSLSVASLPAPRRLGGLPLRLQWTR